MARKPRKDSLYSRLAVADPTLELREKVFADAIIAGRGLEEIAEELNAMGVEASVTGISEMLKRHSLRWKLAKADEAAAEADKWKPRKGKGTLVQQLRANLKRLMWEASYKELTVQELVMLQRALTDEVKAQTALYKTQYEAAEFIAEVLREAKKAEELRALAGRNDLTSAEFIEAVRRRVYGAAAAEPIGEEVGA